MALRLFMTDIIGDQATLPIRIDIIDDNVKRNLHTSSSIRWSAVTLPGSLASPVLRHKIERKCIQSRQLISRSIEDNDIHWERIPL